MDRAIIEALLAQDARDAAAKRQRIPSILQPPPPYVDAYPQLPMSENVEDRRGKGEVIWDALPFGMSFPPAEFWKQLVTSPFTPYSPPGSSWPQEPERQLSVDAGIKNIRGK